VDAAIHVLQECGYANLTISKVADRAGLTNGAMQHHFASREEMVIAVLDALYPVLEIPFEDIASREWDVKERVSAFIDLLWQIYSRPEYLVIWDIAFGTRGDAPLKAKLQDYQRDISARVRKQLAASFADVGVTMQDAEQIFAVVISCLRGFALQAVFGVDRHRSDLDHVKEIANQCIAKHSTRKK
jgi:AcrR family transcriptional regulator